MPTAIRYATLALSPAFLATSREDEDEDEEEEEEEEEEGEEEEEEEAVALLSNEARDGFCFRAPSVGLSTIRTIWKMFDEDPFIFQRVHSF